MAFIDELELHVCAGDGGDGVVRWQSMRRKPKGGPSGGDGGNGGDVYVRGVRDIGLLRRYRGNPNLNAPNGEPGGDKSLHGANGDDLVIDLPVGSLVTRVNTGEVFELTAEGEMHRILRGGRGGYGNEHFKGSRNVRPEQSTPGKPGECDTLQIELQLIADLGLVGFPNAGKSTLLNTFTNARAKTGDYAFTTLEPNLGNLGGYIIADIPGLIEGAHLGKGLGHRFLRHIKRTKALIFCISVEREDAISAFDTILSEIAAFDPHLETLPRMVFVTKTDLGSETHVAQQVEALRTRCKSVHPVSVEDPSSIKEVSEMLVRYLRSQEGVQ